MAKGEVRTCSIFRLVKDIFQSVQSVITFKPAVLVSPLMELVQIMPVPGTVPTAPTAVLLGHVLVRSIFSEGILHT
jgi:hypothetical protein